MRKPSNASAKPMSPTVLAELKENALGVLAECRRQLLTDYSPFIGTVAMNLELKATHDRRNPTACTDGNTVFFDIDFLSGLSPDDRMFAFAHEVWHNVMCHFSRMDGRIPKLSNIATDIEVNQLLKADGFSVPKIALMPKLYDLPEDLSAEEYYELLLKQSNKDSGDGGGGSQGSDGDPSGANGNQDGSLNGQFDKHITNQYDPSTDPTGKGQSDKYGALGDDPDFQPNFSPEAVKKNMEKMREITVSAAQQIERTKGELPAHLKRLVKDLLEPEIPWQETLIQFVTKAVGNRNCWSRPNRRFVHQRIYLPAKDGEKIKIAIGLDTSGSTACDIKKFLSEVNAIVNGYSNYEIHLIQCDAEVQDYTLYTEENPLDLAHSEFKVCGGGGTRMQPIFDYINEHELDADCVAIFTDGFIEEMNEKDAPNVPVLWVVTEDGSTDAMHYGEILKFRNPRNAEAD